MLNNPYFNAVAASAYIGAVALLMHGITSVRHDTPDTFLDGIAFISLLVFSVATMAYLFFYQPVVLLIDKRQKEAVEYFLKTLGTFGGITFVAVVAMLLLG